MATPTVRKLQLGNELRRLREAAQVTSTQAAKLIDADTSKISRLEQGQSGITVGDLRMLLDLYDTPDELAASLVALSRGNRETGRWVGDRSSVRIQVRRYFDLEADADSIRWAEVELVPGLLQTEGYIRAMVARPGPGDVPLDPDAVVAARQARQEVMDRERPPELSFVLSESSVRRMIGGPAVMAEQLEHLVSVSRRPSVQLQLHPFDAEPTARIGERFTLLHIPSPGVAPPLRFVYVEDMFEARYLEDPTSIRSCETVWNTLQAHALSPEETRHRLDAMAREWRDRS